MPTGGCYQPPPNPYIARVAFGGTTTRGDKKTGGLERFRLGLRRRARFDRPDVLDEHPAWAQAAAPGRQRAASFPDARLRVRIPHRHLAARGKGRRGLAYVPLGIAAASVAALGVGLVPGWYRAIFRPPESGLRGISPVITPVRNFYIVSKNFADPTVDGRSWKLRVGGRAGKQLSLTLDQLRALPATEEYVTLECISNNVGGPQMSTGKFTGVPLRDLVTKVEPRADANWVAFKAHDGYTESLPVTFVMETPVILVAYLLDDAPLPMGHGYPARILIPGRYGMKGPKWLESIDLVKDEAGGYWEQQGWDHNAVVKTMSRFDVPGEGDIVKIGAIEVGGVA